MNNICLDDESAAQGQSFHWKIDNSASLPAVKIDLFGFVGGDGCFISGFNESDFVKQFRKIDSKRPIDISINSFGGLVYTGLAIYNLLKSHRGKINIRVEGAAMSAATLITSVPNATVTMPRGAMMMIHRVSVNAAGNADDLKKSSDELIKLEENLIDIYEQKCGKSRDEIRQKINNETYFTAKEAVEFGLADQMDEDSQVSNLKTPQGIFINGLSVDAKFLQHVPADFFTEVAQAPENTKNPRKEEKTMDLAQLRAQYPDLVATLQSEAEQKGAEKERNRIQALDELALSGHSDLLNAAKADPTITPEAFAVQLIKAEKTKKTAIQKQMTEDASDLNGIDSAANTGFETPDFKSAQEKQTANENDQKELDACIQAAAAQFNKHR